MMSKDLKITDRKTNHNPSIITSDTNKELKKQIKRHLATSIKA